MSSCSQGCSVQLPSRHGRRCDQAGRRRSRVYLYESTTFTPALPCSTCRHPLLPHPLIVDAQGLRLASFTGPRLRPSRRGAIPTSSSRAFVRPGRGYSVERLDRTAALLIALLVLAAAPPFVLSRASSHGAADRSTGNDPRIYAQASCSRFAVARCSSFSSPATEPPGQLNRSTSNRRQRASCWSRFPAAPSRIFASPRSAMSTGQLHDRPGLPLPPIRRSAHPCAIQNDYSISSRIWPPKRRFQTSEMTLRIRPADRAARGEIDRANETLGR